MNRIHIVLASLLSCSAVVAQAETVSQTETITIPIGQFVTNIGSSLQGAFSKLTSKASAPTPAIASAPAATVASASASAGGFSIASGVWTVVTGPGPYGTTCENVTTTSVVPAIAPGTPSAKITKILGDAGENTLGGEFGNAGPDPTCKTLHSSLHGLTADFSAMCTQGSRKQTLHIRLTMAPDGRSGHYVNLSPDSDHPNQIIQLRRTGDLPRPDANGMFSNSCDANLVMQ